MAKLTVIIVNNLIARGGVGGARLHLHLRESELSRLVSANGTALVAPAMDLQPGSPLKSSQNSNDSLPGDFASAGGGHVCGLGFGDLRKREPG
jgi:hypothetical protein